jgi:hypothetical protein
VFNISMQIFAVILILLLAVTGCSTKTQRLEAQHAMLVQQNAALQKQLAASLKGVTVIGPVENPFVPWVAGLTLAQAVATANYLDPNEPKEIIITRQGETASLDAQALLSGAAVPLEMGDVIEIRP